MYTPKLDREGGRGYGAEKKEHEAVLGDCTVKVLSDADEHPLTSWARDTHDYPTAVLATGKGMNALPVAATCAALEKQCPPRVTVNERDVSSWLLGVVSGKFARSLFNRTRRVANAKAVASRLLLGRAGDAARHYIGARHSQSARPAPFQGTPRVPACFPFALRTPFFAMLLPQGWVGGSAWVCDLLDVRDGNENASRLPCRTYDT